jgi:hypothetical protein
VRVLCDCGACREIELEVLARLVSRKVTLKELALRMRCMHAPVHANQRTLTGSDPGRPALPWEEIT